MRSLTTRLAAALAVLLLLGAAAATFLPTSSDRGSTCGNWLAPEWTEGKSQDLLDDYAALADSPGSDAVAGDIVANTDGIREAYFSCGSKLDHRMVLTLVLFGSAAIVPMLIVFIGGAVRPRESVNA